MHPLRQSTASIAHVGPLLASDGVTPNTTFAAVAGSLDLFKANLLASIDISARTWTHISGGIYGVALTPGDLDTPGPLEINLHPAALKPVQYVATVLSQTTYDAMCGGALFQASAMAINGNATSAQRLALGAGSTQPIVVQNGALPGTIPTDLTQATSAFFIGRTLVMTSGALAGQAAAITGYNGATKQLTVSQFTSAPALGDIGLIV